MKLDVQICTRSLRNGVCVCVLYRWFGEKYRMLRRVAFQVLGERVVEHALERIPVVDETVFDVRLYLHVRVGRFQTHRVDQVALAVRRLCSGITYVHAVRFVG